jgi:hypothetical protein
VVDDVGKPRVLGQKRGPGREVAGTDRIVQQRRQLLLELLALEDEDDLIAAGVHGMSLQSGLLGVEWRTSIEKLLRAIPDARLEMHCDGYAIHYCRIRQDRSAAIGTSADGERG